MVSIVKESLIWYKIKSVPIVYGAMLITDFLVVLGIYNLLRISDLGYSIINLSKNLYCDILFYIIFWYLLSIIFFIIRKIMTNEFVNELGDYELVENELSRLKQKLEQFISQLNITNKQVTKNLKKLSILLCNSPEINAFVVGDKHIIVTTKFLYLTDEEQSAILAHELSHLINRDSTVNIDLYFSISSTISTLIIWFISYCYERSGLQLFLLVVTCFFTFPFIIYYYLIKFILYAYSRRAEYRADQLAYQLGYSEYLHKALSKVKKEYKFNLMYSIQNFITGTHPHLLERLDRMKSGKYPKERPILLSIIIMTMAMILLGLFWVYLINDFSMILLRKFIDIIKSIESKIYTTKY